MLLPTSIRLLGTSGPLTQEEIEKLPLLFNPFTREDMLQRIAQVRESYAAGKTRLFDGPDGRDLPISIVVAEIVERISALKAAHGIERNLVKEIEMLKNTVEDMASEVAWRKEPERMAVLSNSIATAQAHLDATHTDVTQAEDDLKFVEAIEGNFYSTQDRKIQGELAWQESYLSRYKGSGSEDEIERPEVLLKLRDRYANDVGLVKNVDGQYVLRFNLVDISDFRKLDAMDFGTPKVADCQAEANKYQAMESFDRTRYNVMEGVRTYRQRLSDARQRTGMAAQYLAEEKLKLSTEQRAISVLHKALERNQSRFGDAQNNYAERMVAVTEDIANASLGAALCAIRLREICRQYGISGVPQFDLDRDKPVGDDLYVSRFGRQIQEIIYTIERKRSRLVRTHQWITPSWNRVGDHEVYELSIDNGEGAGLLSGVFLVGKDAGNVEVSMASSGQAKVWSERSVLELAVHAMPESPHDLPPEAAILRNVTNQRIVVGLKKPVGMDVRILVRKDIEGVY